MSALRIFFDVKRMSADTRAPHLDSANSPACCCCERVRALSLNGPPRAPTTDRSLMQRMSPLLAQSGHPSLPRTCPLSGVKRTSVLHCICLLMTQSGHGLPFNDLQLKELRTAFQSAAWWLAV